MIYHALALPSPSSFVFRRPGEPRTHLHEGLEGGRLDEVGVAPRPRKRVEVVPLLAKGREELHARENEGGHVHASILARPTNAKRLTT